MRSFKFSMFLLIVAAQSVAAQNKQQQITNEIIKDQKMWQQSKMPTRTIYNNNVTYKVPLFPDEHRYSGNSISHYDNLTVAKTEKTNFLIWKTPPLKYPYSKKDSLNNFNKSFIQVFSSTK